MNKPLDNTAVHKAIARSIAEPKRNASENWVGSLASATLLAQSISEYWAAKGKRVTFEIQCKDDGDHKLYMIRSDMMNGLPR